MDNKPKGKIYPKQQLEIVTYEADISYSEGTKYLDRATAKNLSLPQDDPLYGKPIRHTIFNGELKAFLAPKEVGFRFLADVEERDRPDKPEFGPDRTIVQVYDNGEPVSRKTKGGGGYGQSPESIRLKAGFDLELENVKRRSIEGQVFAAQVGNVLTCPTTVPGEDLGIDEEAWKRILAKYWLAVERGLDNYLAEPTPRQVAKPPAAYQKAQDGQRKAEKPPQVSKDAPPPTDPIKHVGDLLTRAGKLKPPVSREVLCLTLNKKDSSEIKDLEAAWKTALEISAAKAKKQPAGPAAAGNPGETTDEAWDKIKRPGA